MKDSQRKAMFANMTAYNVKLKKSETIQNPTVVTMKNGRHAIKGTGSDGTGMFRIISKSQAEELRKRKS